ncbi:hypothetical protein DFP72DRAFT_849249 [Ephemerocybe angulata]|uniref:Nephrocystin 3-like N-terminal domain-containing protein n=1 Tax=Ephemerocybe angulata TaxID=980116 RepID=A0A8H6HUR9_9AGAR|nr:hypothetical protein DFP72DRAFT_849249 [Tulosesus angulatus]
MDFNLQGARDHMDVGQGGAQFFSGASNITARDITVKNAGRDMINNIIVNPAPISGPEATIEEVTKWLQGANFRAIYRLSLETRMANTGTWFIATLEFGEFVRQKGTVVWATGLPGSGKTILASISVEHLEDTFSNRADVAILYAFLRFSEEPTLLQIIAGLLTQLVSCHSIAFSHLLPTYQRAKRHGDELSCSEAVKLLKSVLGLFSDTFIVIDGLDEVDDTIKGGLLNVLTALHAHILLTCRPLEVFMRHHTPCALHILVQAQTRDIEVYIAGRIKENGAKLAFILSERPDIAERFAALVKETSQGMFLLARLQMELVLERCTTIGSLLKALETLPSGINDMYCLTMDRISSLSEEEVSLAHRTFLWILHSRETLSPEDLQHALTFSYESTKFDEDNSTSLPILLSICCGLVIVEDRKAWFGTKKVVRFIHYSTLEFMRSFAFPHLPNPHDLLAVTSVACVENHLPVLAAILESMGTHDSDWRPLIRHIPLLRYAIIHWGHHAKICDDQRTLSPFIHSFLSNHGAYAIVDRKGYLSEASQGLNLAATYDLTNLIASGTLQYSPEHGTETPFHVAAEGGHAGALCTLLKNYSGVHVKDEAGRTPLHRSVSSPFNWEPDIVQQLLHLSPTDTWRAFPSEVVDINAQDEQGRSAFWEACHSLAYHGFEIPSDFIDGTTLKGKILRILSSYPGIEVDLPDSHGDTPFSRMCNENGSAVPQFLISSIPNLKVDTRNEWDETPFMHACDAKSEWMVEWFLSRDGPGGWHLLRQEDDEGLTVLGRVLAYEGFATVRNREGRSNFKLRAYQRKPGWGNLEDPDQIDRILITLSKQGNQARVARAGHGPLPIYQFRNSRAQTSPMVHVYLNDDHRRYEDERTSLMLLANYPAAVKHLVSRNEDNPNFINALDIDGRCAIMYASFGQDSTRAMKSVKTLTSCPSLNVHLRDRDGMSALDYALFSYNWDAATVLLDHPSWTSPTIRSAVITAARQRNISLHSLEWLLDARQGAFSFWPGDNMEDGTALKMALLGRDDGVCLLENQRWGWVFNRQWAF